MIGSVFWENDQGGGFRECMGLVDFPGLILPATVMNHEDEIIGQKATAFGTDDFLRSLLVAP